MKPVRKATDERIVDKIHGRIARLERRQGAGVEVVDLAPLLYVYDGTPGSTYEAWDTAETASESAGFHVTGGRCFLTGEIHWWGSSSKNGSRGAHGNLSINDTALPPDAWPPAQITLKVPVDSEWTVFDPTLLGGTDAVYGATVSLVVTADGFIEHPTTFANYKGVARKADGTNFTEGVPNGTVLILEGASWLVG